MAITTTLSDLEMNTFIHRQQGIVDQYNNLLAQTKPGDLPANILAQKIIVQSMLVEMHKADSDSTQDAGINLDEWELFKTVTSAMQIPTAVLVTAKEEYYAQKNGCSLEWNSEKMADQQVPLYKLMLPQTSKEINSMFIEPAKFEKLSQWTSLASLIESINAKTKKNNLHNDIVLQQEEYAARQIQNLEILAGKRTGKEVKINHDGLSLGEVYAFLEIAHAGQLGHWFGFPVDHEHLGGEEAHTIETLLPTFATWKKNQYHSIDNNHGLQGGRLPILVRRDDAPVSSQLYSLLISRAYQGRDKTIITNLDKFTAAKYKFTADNLAQLYNAAAEPLSTEGDLRSNEGRWIENLKVRDNMIDGMIRGAITDYEHYPVPAMASEMPEINNLYRLVEAYNQIMADDIFTDSERGLFDAALEYSGIRLQLTRDFFLDVERGANGKIISGSQTANNMDKFYSSKFFEDLRLTTEQRPKKRGGQRIGAITELLR